MNLGFYLYRQPPPQPPINLIMKLMVTTDSCNTQQTDCRFIHIYYTHITIFGMRYRTCLLIIHYHFGVFLQIFLFCCFPHNKFVMKKNFGKMEQNIAPRPFNNYYVLKSPIIPTLNPRKSKM